MPAVAQISVDFAKRSEIQNIQGSDLPTSVKSVSPRTLQQYLLYNRELNDEGENFGLLDSKNLSYDGGFITAGDKINVKHNDLQLRENLEVGKEVRAEFIVSRNKELGDDVYETNRPSSTRAVTISPKTSEIPFNFLKTYTDPSVKYIHLVTLRSSIESSIKIKNSSSDTSISVLTNKFTLTAPDIIITGDTTHTGTILVTGQTTINNTVRIKDDLNLGTSSFNKFNVVGTSGNVSFTGNLTIATNKFKVNSSNGNTDIFGNLNIGNSNLYNKFNVNSSNGNTSIAGTLTVALDTSLSSNLNVANNTNISGDMLIQGSSSFQSSAEFDSDVTIEGQLDINNSVNIQNNLNIGQNLNVSNNTAIEGTLTVTGTTTTSNSISLVGGDQFAASRRIIGVRTFTDSQEMFGITTYDKDALNVGDFKKYAFQPGMIMMFNGSIQKDSDGVLVNPSGGWALCDGESLVWNNSPFTPPDLRARFIVGAGVGNTPNNNVPDDPKYYSLNVKGGSNFHTLNVTEMPQHNHNSSSSTQDGDINITVTGGGHNHGNFVTSVNRIGGGQFGSGENNSISAPTGSGNNGAHSHSGSFTLYKRGGSAKHENRPPFYALYYIIKL